MLAEKPQKQNEVQDATSNNKSKLSQSNQNVNAKNEEELQDSQIQSSDFKNNDDNKNEQSSNKNTGKIQNQEIDAIQREIQEMTKKIEHEKINQRICNERYEKKFVQYCELSGKPVPMAKEDKEKERKKRLKKTKNHRVSDPIDKKRTKESIISENQAKNLKMMNLNENAVGTLTNEINDLELENQALLDEIKELRKQKNAALHEKEKIIEDNNKYKEDIEEIKERNKNSEKRIKINELKKSRNLMEKQRKNFATSRDEMESNYHKIIEESIKRERENKKEAAKKRQMLSLVSDSKAIFKGANTIELEKQKKMLEAEEISDRTPIIELHLNKWKFINKYKKYMSEKYAKNSQMIRDSFDKLINFLGLDNYSDLPTVFRKAERQMSDIEFYKTQLLTELDDIDLQKKILNAKIKFLDSKLNKGNEERTTFTESKANKIYQLKKDILDTENDIQNKRNFFKRIQPDTDEYLEKLNGTYLNEYVQDKCRINPEIKYNEKTVNDFICNVQDYYELIQMYDSEINKKIPIDDQNDINKLRGEIRVKLNLFESQRLMTENLTTSMKLDVKGGSTYDDIIKKSSDLLLGQVRSQNFGIKKYKKTLRIKTEA